MDHPGGLYEITADALVPVSRSSFGEAGVYERRDLQRLLREQIDVISPRTMVLSEEFGDWDDSKRRIDLLGLDTEANLVVIELKRDETGAHMELQALRYAAMVSTMTFAQAVETYARHAATSQESAQAVLLEFLSWGEPDEERFAPAVRIVLASSEFSKELATSVLWLNERGLDIRCVRMHPYDLGGRILVDIQPAIPLPEAAELQVKIREKAERVRESREQYRDFTRYDLRIEGDSYSRQPKRRVIFLVIQRAMRRAAATPEQVTAMLDRNAWAVADGVFDTEDGFVQAISAQYTAVGRPFDAPRWFAADSELFQFDGRTLAFSKMWSGDAVLRAVHEIQRLYPQLAIEISPSD